MGLDAIELIMDTEDRFGVDLPDKEVSEITTIGQLHNLISKLYHEKKQSDTSAIQKVFYELRKVLVTVSGLHEKEITPATLTENVFPKANRSDQWKAVSRIMKIEFPKLVLPQKLQSINSVFSLIFWITIIALFVGLFLMHQMPFLFWKCLLFFFTILFGIVLMTLLQNSGIAKEIPNSCQTLEDLTRCLIAKNPDNFKPYSKEDIWEILKYMIAEQSGLEIAQITPETSFMEVFPYDYK